MKFFLVFGRGLANGPEHIYANVDYPKKKNVYLTIRISTMYCTYVHICMLPMITELYLVGHKK